MADVLKKLHGGDRRSIGRSEEVARQICEQPGLFPVVFDGMLHSDPLIRMRAADAIEKVTAQHPDLLQSYKAKLIQSVARVEQQEVRWHVAQMLPRLRLRPKEQEAVFYILLEYLNDESRIVKTFSMQALAELALANRRLLSQVTLLLDKLTQTGSPAMKSRGRRLLAQLKRSATTIR